MCLLETVAWVLFVLQILRQSRPSHILSPAKMKLFVDNPSFTYPFVMRYEA